MQFQVINKKGFTITHQYPCFGALQSVDSWYSRGSDDLRNPEGVKIDDEALVVGKETYLAGFHPSDFDTLVYNLPFNRTNQDMNDDYFDFEEEVAKQRESDDNLEQIVQRLPGILKHPLFSNLTLVKTESGYDVHSKMDGKQMDETIYPLFVIRNLCEYFDSFSGFKILEEAGVPAGKAAIYASVYRPYNNWNGNIGVCYNGSDGALMWSSHAPLGDLATLMSGQAPYVYTDYVWGDHPQGYACDGRYQQPNSNHSWEDTDDNELHPFTMEPRTLTSVSCFKRSDLYSGKWENSLQKSRPENKEGYINLAKELCDYVENE